MFFRFNFFSKLSAFFLVVLASNLSAQNQPVIYEFAPGQEFYQGGKPQLYKEIHQILLDKKLGKCESEDENYVASVLIKEDSKISFVKDFDTVAVQSNKCAYDLIRNVLPHLKNWKSASVDGKRVNAIARIAFLPDALFDKYKEGSVILEPTDPEFPGGIHAFRQQFMRNFNADVIGHGRRKVNIELTFVVGQDGVIQDIKFSGDKDKQFSKEAIRALSQITTRWTPATINGSPVRYRFRLPLQMVFESQNKGAQKEPPFDNLFKPAYQPAILSR